MAELRGIRFAPSLQQETSEYYRTLTPALEMLVRVLGARGGGGKWVAKGSDWGSRAEGRLRKGEGPWDEQGAAGAF